MKPNYSLESVLIAVCDYYQVTKEQLISRSRKPFLVKARQMYFFMCDSFTDNSLTKTADLIERDHSTCLYSVQKIKVEKEIYFDVRTDIKGLTEKLLNTDRLIIENVDLLRLSENYTKSFI